MFGWFVIYLGLLPVVRVVVRTYGWLWKDCIFYLIEFSVEGWPHEMPLVYDVIFYKKFWVLGIMDADLEWVRRGDRFFNVGICQFVSLDSDMTRYPEKDNALNVWRDLWFWIFLAMLLISYLCLEIIWPPRANNLRGLVLKNDVWLVNVRCFGFLGYLNHGNNFRLKLSTIDLVVSFPKG